MRRLLMVCALAALMAAMMVLIAAPAIAQRFDNNNFNRGGFFGNNNDRLGNFFGNNGRLSSDIDQDSQSGDVSLGFRVSNSGDYASQCTPAIQQGNTGNFDNASSFIQYDGRADDFEPGGIDVSFGGSQDVSCPSTIQQSSAASS
jgi:hypothetical protein